MKQKDIALVVIIVLISVVFSLFLSNALITPPKNRHQNVEVVQPITATFPNPDSRYFNNQAFDPTQLIRIGQNSNTNPFGSAQ